MSAGVRIILFCTLLATANAEWTQFRGPNATGIIPSTAQLPTKWSEKENVRWKTEIPHLGHSSPVIGHGKIWLTSATEDGTQQFVICVDQQSGEVLLNRKLWDIKDPEPLGNPVNGYASPSPALGTDFVIIHFGSYGTVCLNTKDFTPRWERRDLDCRHYRGPGSSPVLWKNRVILTMDGVDTQYLVALDEASGKTVWKVDRSTDFQDLDPKGNPKANGDFRKAYSTPVFIPVGETIQMLSVGARAAFAYEPETGKEIWNITYPGYSNASLPVFTEDALFVNTGFGKPHLLRIKKDPNASGDITESHVEWDIMKRVPKRSSPVITNNVIFMISEAGIASAIDPINGESHWDERILGKVTASPIATQNVVYFFDEAGKTSIVSADKNFKLLHQNKLKNGCMATPAVDGNALFIRTKTHLYRIENTNL